CIAAGIACLWGPAHGGANEAALKMLGEIGSVDRIPEYIKRSKDKNDSFRLMGFGHRVYKHYDPRAKIMQRTAHEVLNELGFKDLMAGMSPGHKLVGRSAGKHLASELYCPHEHQASARAK